MSDTADAVAAAAEPEFVAWGEGSVAQAKELERRLAESDIQVTLAKPAAKACCGGGCGCGAKLQIMVRKDDVQRVAQVLQGDWLDAVKREGLLSEGSSSLAFGGGLVQLGTPEGSAELVCPACGFSGALINGACGDCGLQLE